MKLSLLSKLLLAVVVCVSGTFQAAAADQIYTNKSTTNQKVNKEIKGTYTWTGTENQKVDYSNNTVTYTGSSSTWIVGGALGMDKSSETKLTITDYGQVSFSQNCAESTEGKSRAAAVVMGGSSSKNSLTISGNSDVTFQENTSTAAREVAGAAVYVGSNAVADVTGNTNVTFKDNKAESTDKATGTAYGSIYINGDSSGINLSENTGHVLFEANKVINSTQHAYGGAIAVNNDTSTAAIKKNVKLSFIGNYVKVGSADTSAVMRAAGGAIYEKSADLSISGNDEVVFERNYVWNANGKDSSAAQRAYSARGGAIYSGGVILNDTTTNEDNISSLSISGNKKVTFKDNFVRFDGVYTASDSRPEEYLRQGEGCAPKVAGGAIYASYGINIQGNDDVLFSGNYEKTSDGYRLRSIYATSHSTFAIYKDDDPSVTPTYLSVNEGGRMEFRDGMTLNGSIQLGEGPYAPAYAKSPVYLNSEYNGKSQTGKIIFTGRYTEGLLQDIKNKDNAGSVTESEIANSRRFEMNGDTTLYAGTLSLQDDAVMQATKLTVKSGATLEAVRTDDVAALVFDIDAQDVELLSPAATLSADLVLEDGAMVSLNGGNINMDEHSLTVNGSLAVTLSGDLLGEDEIVLFSNVKTLTGIDELSDITVNGVATSGSFANGNVIINIADVPNIPEPTTVTLSLMALAGLAARRRRK